MRTRVRIIVALLVFGMLMAGSGSVKAQCAMCTATVESSTDNGDGAAKGLNAGILFLLVAPYLVVGIGGYVWYKKYRRKNTGIDVPEKKLHLN